MITTQFSARVAILEAYSMNLNGVSEFEPRAGRSASSSTNIIAHAYEAGKIIAAVESQADQLKHWLIWAHGPAVFAMLRSVQIGAVAAVFEQSELSLSAELPPPVALRTQLLAYAHMENYRSLAVTGHRKYRKPAHFDQAVRRISGGQIGFNLSGRNFARDYGWLAEVVESACAELDRRSLPRVGAALASVREFRGEACAL